MDECRCDAQGAQTIDRRRVVRARVSETRYERHDFLAPIAEIGIHRIDDRVERVQLPVVGTDINRRCPSALCDLECVVAGVEFIQIFPLRLADINRFRIDNIGQQFGANPVFPANDRCAAGIGFLFGFVAAKIIEQILLLECGRSKCCFLRRVQIRQTERLPYLCRAGDRSHHHASRIPACAGRLRYQQSARLKRGSV